jgi:hypothetical protein
MVDLLALGFVLLIVIGIAKAAGGRHYSEMTEEEFEAEAKRGSPMGAAVSGLQKIIDPAHPSEHIVEQQQRIEADRSDSGGPRKPGAPPDRMLPR